MPHTVLFFHSSAGRYGADLQLLALAGGLDPERFRVTCVLPERGELAPLLEGSGAEVVVHPLAVLRRGLLSPAGLGGIALRSVADRRVLGRLARSRKAAIVHSNTSVVLSGQAVARVAGARHVMHVREIYPPSRAWPAMRRRLLRADATVCISEAVAAQFGGRARVLRDGLHREPHRAERETARATLGVAGDAFAVALVGRISDWKGQDVLARALADPALASIGAVGLVAGDAFPGNEDAERRLRDLRDSLGLGERMRLLGFREDIDTVLGAADALVVPSTRPEPLGLVALEAAAAGLPVVASAHGGVTEVVRDGDTGLLTPPGDPAALATALRSLADDPDRAARLAAAAAEEVRSRYGLERMIREVEDLYLELMSGEPPVSS